MGERRRIVPDTSVILGSLFPSTLVGESLIRIGPRARTITDALYAKTVVAFAPEQLIAEVVKGAYRICTDRAAAKYLTLTREQAYKAVNEFFGWPIQYVATEGLAVTALQLVHDGSISAPDSWFVACAMQHEAELWISHEHRDGVVRNTRARYSNVFTLAERPLILG